MVTNDDWQAASNQSEISLSNQAPSDPKEAAVLLALDAGEYSILLSDSTGGNGTALLEVINLDPAKNGKIQSVGVRGEVDSVEPMIHSLNLQGSNEMSLLSLLRGKDSLASLGVPNGLPNPRQSLLTSDTVGQWTVLSENDDWETHPQSFLFGDQADPPLGLKDSGIVTTLSEGEYVFHLMSSTNTDTGDIFHEVVDLGIPPGGGKLCSPWIESIEWTGSGGKSTSWYCGWTIYRIGPGGFPFAVLDDPGRGMDPVDGRIKNDGTGSPLQ